MKNDICNTQMLLMLNLVLALVTILLILLVIPLIVSATAIRDITGHTELSNCFTGSACCVVDVCLPVMHACCAFADMDDSPERHLESTDGSNVTQ